MHTRREASEGVLSGDVDRGSFPGEEQREIGVIDILLFM